MGNSRKSIPSFFIPFAAILLSLIGISAQAQDDGITSFDLQYSNSELVEHENKTTKSSIVTRDSLQMSDFYQKPKMVVDRKTTTSESNEGNDALSLNFLFYIIENYKFSDLIGE
jgi:hypothetical protein